MDGGGRGRALPAAFGLAATALLLLGLAGAPAAAAELDQYGKAHAWAGDLGAVTVLDFAASWCPPCIQSLPRLQELARRAPAVRFLVVSVDEKQAGRDFLVRELGLELPVLWDEEHRIAETYQPEGMPSTFLLGASGEVLYSHVGFTKRGWQELERRVLALGSNH